MKPTSTMPDAIFKQRITSYLRSTGKVVAAFDNEPANVNVYRRAFGADTISVLFETLHSPNPPPLIDGVYRLDSFEAPTLTKSSPKLSFDSLNLKPSATPTENQPDLKPQVEVESATPAPAPTPAPSEAAPAATAADEAADEPKPSETEVSDEAKATETEEESLNWMKSRPAILLISMLRKIPRAYSTKTKAFDASLLRRRLGSIDCVLTGTVIRYPATRALKALIAKDDANGHRSHDRRDNGEC